MIKVNDLTLKRFASRLKFARKEKKLSQTEFGKAVGKVQQEVYRLEHGMTYPDKETIFQYAELLGVDPIWLSGESKQNCEYKITENDEYIEIKARIYKKECMQCDSAKIRETARKEFENQNPVFKNYFYNLLYTMLHTANSDLANETKETYFDWGKID